MILILKSETHPDIYSLVVVKQTCDWVKKVEGYVDETCHVVTALVKILAIFYFPFAMFLSIFPEVVLNYLLLSSICCSRPLSPLPLSPLSFPPSLSSNKLFSVEGTKL